MNFLSIFEHLGVVDLIGFVIVVGAVIAYFIVKQKYVDDK